MTFVDPVTKDSNAKAVINAALKDWNLQGLADWAWQRYKETDSIDLVMLEMQERPEYQKRFAGRLGVVAHGFQMTEAEQLAWENQARATFRAAGMPSTFYDSWEDFQPLIASGMSPVELGQRVNDAFVKVTQQAPEIRRAFAEYYGPNSDAAIASMILDEKKALPVIQEQVAAAQAGGYIRQQGYAITRSLAEQIALANGNDASRFQQGAEQLGTFGHQGLFNPLWGETNTASVETAAKALLGHDSQAELDLQRAMDLRAATTKGSSDQTSQGFGKANRT